MIAAMSPSAQQQQYPMPDDLEERLCPGCKLSVVSEEGGLVVAFGQCFFHVNCFKCAKCNDKVTADTNLLLLSDGSPICANCSYACNVCKQPILDEAIMTGDDAYHAHCFKCKVCKNRIDELVFAKTSQGIYCMDCHNERMIKIRKHTQKKAERERERQAAQAAAYNELGIGGSNKGGSISTSARDRERRARELLGKEASIQPSRSTEFSQNGHISPPIRAPYVPDAFQPEPTRNQLPIIQPPPRTSSVDSSSNQRPPLVKNHSLPVTLEEPPSPNRSEIPSISVPPTNGSLTVTSVRDKRRSINPGLVIKPPGDPSTASSSALSPAQRSPTPPVNGTSNDSPTSARLASPLREKFPSSRPGSASSNSSYNALPQRTRTTSAMSSSSSTGATVSYNGDDSTVTMRPSPSPLRPTSPFAASSPRPDSASSLSEPKRFSGRSLSPRPGSATSRDRPPSRADVPRSVESATDDDEDEEEQQHFSRDPPQRSMTDDSGGYSLIDAYGGADVDAVEVEKMDQHQRNQSTESTPPMPPPKDSRTKPPAPLSTLPKRESISKRVPLSAMSDPPSLTPEPNASFSMPSPDAPTAVPREPAPPPALHSPSLSVPRMTRNASYNSITSSSVSGHGEFSDTETTETSAEDKELMDAEIEAEENGEDTANRATATFIAPALPPIRFSLNTADFSDLFTSVGGNVNNPMKTFDAMASVTENREADNGDVPSTPPPSAVLYQPNTMSQSQTVFQPQRAVSESPSPGPTPPLPSMPLPNESSTSIYTSTNESTTIAGSIPNSEDGHSSNSDHQHQKEKKEKEKEKGGLLRKLSGKRSKLDRSASSAKALKDRERKVVAEAMRSAGLAAPNMGDRTPSDPQLNGHSPTTITISPPLDGRGEWKEPSSSADIVLQRLQEVFADATDRGAQQLKLDRGFVEAIVNAMTTRKTEYLEAKKQIDGMKRASKQYIDGISVAQTEYDRELKARRDAEAEVTRLRVLLSGQAARLTALTGDSRRQELRQKMSKELHENLNGLEFDLSKLKVERDVTLAEVEELNAASSSGAASEPSANLSRSLTKRLDTLKSQYQRELLPLTQQREALTREVMELKAARDVFLEETTVLNARNEELAQLSAQYSRRVVMAPQVSSIPDTPSKTLAPTILETPVRSDSRSVQLQQQTPQQLHHMMVSAYSSTDDLESRKIIRVDETPTPSRGGNKVFKWGSRKESTSVLQSGAEKGKVGHLEHSFQPLSLLRFTRCDHCGDKMWGSQLRCSGCSISVHTRCVNQVHSACSQQGSNGGNVNEEPQVLPLSMFGRDLTEQVRADGRGGPRNVPVIVEKCIEAVEELAMDYEGIYRKTGGSGQSRIITQLFERGDYSSFDLRDSDRFNDICSVTSVLKTYLRSLPVPLLTHDLHDEFMSAVEIRDPVTKNNNLTELVNKLPSEHYYTVRLLMLHLNRICQRSDVNLMNARNLGVVFGPTLMRSRNPGAEFSDMAGKALTIEWLVESAPQVFITSDH